MGNSLTELCLCVCAGFDCRGAEQRATRDEAGQPGAAQDQHHCAKVEHLIIQNLCFEKAEPNFRNKDLDT
jgi:hypothetical protein